MESKLVSYKNFFAALLILSSFVQFTLATKDFPRQMLPSKPLGCSDYGEPCNVANWCCPGTECSNSYAGGTCVDDPFSACKHLGESCGFFTGTCCGKRECIAGECADAYTNAVTVSTI